MRANIKKVLEKQTISTNIFKILLQTLKSDTENDIGQIGFVSYYKDDRTGYFLDVYGNKETDYKMHIQEIGCGIVEPVKIELTPFQYEQLRTTFQLNVLIILNDNKEEEENTDFINPFDYGITNAMFLNVS